MGSRFRLLLTLGTGALAGFALSIAGRVFADRGNAPVAGYTAPGGEKGPSPRQDARLLAEVLQRVRESYVDPVDDHQLMRQAVHGLVESLDEHSALLEPGDYAQLQAATSGSYAGIGVEVNGVAEGVRIVRCLPESPAVHAGLKIDDLIVRIDDMAVSAANMDAATTQLRGRPGSEVRLSVRRGQVPATLEFRLQRSLVELPSIAAELVAPGIGYLRINEFTDGTAGEVDAAMPRLHAAAGGGPRPVVIDLRHKPGGVLEAPPPGAAHFLGIGPIVSAHGRRSPARFR